jgi:DNA-binding beta-propeller fold protein YncE
VSGTAKPYFASEGEAAGTFDVVASADGKYVFAANEYGKLQGQRGSVGIIAVNADAQGNVNHPQSIAQIAVGDVVPSLMLSPDGSRLYVATELIPANQPPSIAGAGDPNLTKADCVQTKGTPAQHNGFVTVIDTQRAIQQDPTAVLSRVAAGCSPVRLVEAADSSVLFVSARGDDKILAFAPRSLDKAPEHALLRVFPSGGSAPVGIHLFHQDKLLAVANSNRFADSDGTFAILDVSNVSKSSSVAPPKTWPAGGFPRNIGISKNGATLLLTNYRSRSLQVIQTAMH